MANWQRLRHPADCPIADTSSNQFRNPVNEPCNAKRQSPVFTGTEDVDNGEIFQYNTMVVFRYPPLYTPRMENQ